MMEIEVYVRGKGVQCPFCEGAFIEGGPIEVDAGKAVQEMSCTECEGRWEDIYNLVGFRAFRKRELVHEEGAT